MIKRVAVQLFGHMRTYQQCYKALFKNLVSMYDCDIFIHTWDKIDSNTKSWHNYHIDDENINLEQEVRKLYNPVSIRTDHQNSCDMGQIVAGGHSVSVFGIKSMLDSMQRSNDLRKKYQSENNIKYDMVVFVRPDIMLKEPLNIEKYIDESLGANALYTVGKYKNKSRLNDWRYIGASDVLFFATPDVFDVMFDNVNDILTQARDVNTTKYGQEYSFIYAIQNMGIRVFLVNYLWGQSFSILRPTNKVGLLSHLLRRYS